MEGGAKLCTTLCILVGGLPYLLFQLHFLPECIGKYVGRLYFYPTLPFTYLARRTEYWTLIDSHVFLGAVPISLLGHVKQLHARGVRAVVNMCDEYIGPVNLYQKIGIKQLRLPVVDHFEPTINDIRKAVDFIDEQVALGVRVYIHCKSGNGRGAAIAFCWLLHKTKLSPQEVQNYLNEKRLVRKELYKQSNILLFASSLSI